jgi:hypothetical protein
MIFSKADLGAAQMAIRANCGPEKRLLLEKNAPSNERGDRTIAAFEAFG